jgi:hypothetical protein
MPALLSHPPTSRAADTDAPPSVASLKQRWRRAVISSGLPVRRRFDLIVLLEHAGGFGGTLSIGEAPTWAVLAGVLRQRDGSYEFDRAWLVQAEADAERRWIERHRADPMRSTRQPAMPTSTEPATAQQ